jgi:hypothetical protein
MFALSPEKVSNPLDRPQIGAGRGEVRIPSGILNVITYLVTSTQLSL